MLGFNTLIVACFFGPPCTSARVRVMQGMVCSLLGRDVVSPVSIPDPNFTVSKYIIKCLII